jgi:hypothetical protein
MKKVQRNNPVNAIQYFLAMDDFIIADLLMSFVIIY